MQPVAVLQRAGGGTELDAHVPEDLAQIADPVLPGCGNRWLIGEKEQVHVRARRKHASAIASYGHQSQPCGHRQVGIDMMAPQLVGERINQRSAPKHHGAARAGLLKFQPHALRALEILGFQLLPDARRHATPSIGLESVSSSLFVADTYALVSTRNEDLAV